MTSTVGYDHATTDDGHGWITFAGVIIAIAGTLNVVYGIAAIDTSDFFVQDVNYVVTGLQTYGWLCLIIGVTQLLAAIGLFAGTAAARWLAIAAVAVNAFVQLLWIPAEPLLSVSLFALDVLILYGLIVHGRPAGRRVT